MASSGLPRQGSGPVACPPLLASGLFTRVSLCVCGLSALRTESFCSQGSDFLTAQFLLTAISSPDLSPVPPLGSPSHVTAPPGSTGTWISASLSHGAPRPSRLDSCLLGSSRPLSMCTSSHPAAALPPSVWTQPLCYPPTPAWLRPEVSLPSDPILSLTMRRQGHEPSFEKTQPLMPVVCRAKFMQWSLPRLCAMTSGLSPSLCQGTEL